MLTLQLNRLMGNAMRNDHRVRPRKYTLCHSRAAKPASFIFRKDATRRKLDIALKDNYGAIRMADIAAPWFGSDRRIVDVRPRGPSLHQVAGWSSISAAVAAGREAAIAIVDVTLILEIFRDPVRPSIRCD